MNDTKLNILLVDDNEDLRNSISDFINLHFPNIKLYEAKDGNEGIRKIEAQPFDLVITDYKMPKTDGVKLLESIQTVDKKNRPKKLMLLTAFPEDKSLANLSGDITIMKKPFDLPVFKRFIENILEPAEKPKRQKKATPAKTSIDVSFLNPFINATLEVLKITAGIEAKKDFIFIKEDSGMLGDIAGLIPIISNKYVGSMAITFSKDVYLGIVSKMLEEEYTEINDENKDGIAELCNQIYGNTKPVLNQQGYELQPSFPTVIFGEKLNITHIVNGKVLAVYFNTPLGDFSIECILHKK